MSGHSHWAGIKHKKSVEDAKRAKVFTKLAKPITMAAREGGGNPESNFKLRMAIEKARAFNMPKNNIEKAIKRGTGKLKGADLEEITYEAVGPGDIMMIIRVTTDNRNRAVSEIKSILAKAGGKISEVGSVMWNFEQVGVIYIENIKKDSAEIELLAIDAGARDTKIEDETLNVFTDPKNLRTVQKNLIKKGIDISDSGLVYLPKNILKIDESTRLDYEKLLENLNEQNDVEEIYDNL